MKQDIIVILDLGSRINTVIAREVREFGVYSEIHPHDVRLQDISETGNIVGIIVNGGDNNIIDGEEISCSTEIYNSPYPMLVVNHKNEMKCEELPSWPQNDSTRKEVLRRFVFDVCNANPNWNMHNFVSAQVELIKKQVGNNKVLLALSGGVDSSVVAALLAKAIGDNLVCVHVNHGLLRLGEPEQVVEVFRDKIKANLIYIDASERFLLKLEGVSDPEQKRKIIGEEFIRVFEEEAKKLEGIKFLAQGTIYPDILESGTKTAKVIKSHHNVGGLPQDLAFELVEPLKQLFKDEVRECGKALGLPSDMVNRQPFPGPGLGVRCTGAISRERLQSVKESDAILREEFRLAGLEGKVWQYFTVVPDCKSVGTRNDERSYEYPVIIRAINTVDAITASVFEIEWSLLQKITDRILSEVKGVNRVCYDVSPKPPGTIEWE